ncbi:DUF6233 domain-containing protein [Streptomyces sp. NPDC054995]
MGSPLPDPYPCPDRGRRAAPVPAADPGTHGHASGPATPPVRPASGPDWGRAEAGIGIPTTEIHRGDCWAGGRSLVPVTAERARAELADGAQPCAVCRPDRVLNRT